MASEHPLLATFQTAYQNTDLTPLVEQGQLDRFWVEYGAEPLAALAQLIEDNASQAAKIIFSGHRGCGKSTLLAELGRKLNEDYFVSVFSIAETIEMSDVNHINILFAIAVNLMLEAEKSQIKIPKAAKDAFHNWFAKRTRTKIETPIHAEASVGFDLFKLIAGKLKTEATIRNEIKQEFERNITDLVMKLDEIAAVIQNVSQKPILVIIDDLDKLDLSVVKSIFQDHIKALFLPGFSIIYTIPIASLRNISLRASLQTESDDQIVVMPVSKLIAREERRSDTPEYREGAIATLCEVLRKRIPAEILSDDIARRMVLESGGVLRELIRISNRCCRMCLRQIRRQPDQNSLTITAEILEQAINDLRLDFEITLGKAEYEILETTYVNFSPDDPKSQEFLDLLHGLHILEYRNSAVWYDIHPIVLDLLKRKGLIHAIS
ncbi:AAA family ATPase [Spirulina major CS-329]|uniref:P-loop NTPase fold protein n=1 Tax=Spirulina TaxID=1154 RepID=UPI00232E5712|nr:MULTISPECIES: P-loop NTPase fold protein [Spirulina]MDB9493156.1 AAA family ATPase [Spirulina subsalsa CS-330]MDB9502294.1 AAA family ATPase [Spirulina major CS-329]